MELIYLDNAATTPMHPEVVKVMQQSMETIFGNPSSIHQFGRKAKVAIEKARKNIAKQFNVLPSEIIFTSSGTEADNLILYNAVENLGVKRIITSKVEHHAVLHSVASLQKKYNIAVSYVKLNEFGEVDLNDLEALLKEPKGKSLVSLMMINNEIGNILPLKEVCDICNKYTALFHSDAVQAIGHYKIDLKDTPIDFMVASAHKFHGPKGVGFAYLKKEYPVKPMLYGGGQEKGIRASTENVHAIIGMEKALAIAYQNLKEDKFYITSLKKYLKEALLNLNQEIQFNGTSSDLEKSSYLILNVRFPIVDKMLLFNLDLAGVAVSGGSACQSGAIKGSHVLNELLIGVAAKKTSVRFSLSKHNTKLEIDRTINVLLQLIK